MRHSDRRLTDKIYTDESLLGTSAAIETLPSFSERASQIASQNLGASGHLVSLPVTVGDGVKVDGTPETIGHRHVLTQGVTTGHDSENGGSGGARTRCKSNKNGVQTASPSQIASQKDEIDLSRLIRKWPKLPKPLKAAVLAIIDSTETQG